MFQRQRGEHWRKLVLVLITTAILLNVFEASWDQTNSPVPPAYETSHWYEYLAHFVGAVIVLTLLSILTRARLSLGEHAWDLMVGMASFLIFVVFWDWVILLLYEALRLYRYGLLFALALTMLVALYIGTHPFVWRCSWPNDLTLWLIQCYLKWDKAGNVYYQIRRLLYAVRHEEEISRRYEMVLLTLIKQEAGQIEGQIDDLEIICRNQKVEAERKSREMSLELWQVHMLANTLVLHRQALADHYCPAYCKEYREIERWMDAAKLWDESWLIGKRLSRLSPPLELAWYPEAKDRAFVLYKGLWDSHELSALEIRFAGFRIAVLKQPSDIGLTEIAAKINAFLFKEAQAKNQKREQELIKFGLTAWIEMLISEGDYQAIIQTCDRLIKSPNGLGMSLSTDIYKHLGYAWWDYAHALGNTDYGLLAWQNALQSFMVAHSQAPLEKLKPPF